MYKNTRHTSATWTYKTRTKSRFGGALILTPKESQQLLLVSRKNLLRLGLVTLLDYPVPTGLKKHPGALPAYLRERRSKGLSYFRKINVPYSLISSLPDYLLIAPCLEIALENLKKLPIENTLPELQPIQEYLKMNSIKSEINELKNTPLNPAKKIRSGRRSTIMEMAFKAAMNKRKT